MSGDLQDAVGEVLEVAPGEALDLGRLAGAWSVRSGAVEVFAVVERDGRMVGNRHFVHAAAVGDVVFAVPADDVSGGRLLAFAAAGAALEPAVPPSLSGFASAIDAWLCGFAQSLARVHSGSRRNGIALHGGDEVTCPAGGSVLAARDVVWGEVVAGRGRFLADPATPLVPGMLVPLAASMWIEADDGELTLRGVNTDRVLRTPGWPACLAVAQAAMLRHLADALADEHAAEDERLRRSIAWSRRALAATVADFADVFRRTDPVVEGMVREDALTAACRAVARAIGSDLPPLPRARSAGSAGMVERIVRQVRMPAREVTLRGAWWREELGPLVGVLADSGAPVALLPAGRRGYRLYDPEDGRVHALGPELARRVAPTAYMLYPTLPPQPMTILGLMRFGRRTSLRDLRTMFLMNGIGALLGLAIPVATGVLVDEFVPSHLRGQLLLMGGMLLFLTLVQLVVKITGDLAQLRLSGRAGGRAQTAIVERTLRLANDVLNRFSSADLAQRALVIDDIRRSFGSVVVESLLSGVFTVASLTLLLFLAPGAAGVALLLFALFLGAALWAGRAQLPALRQSEERIAEASSLVFQLVGNIAQLRAAGAEERAYARWGQSYAAVQRAVLRAARVSTRFAAFAGAYEVASLAVFFAAVGLLRPAHSSTGELLVTVAMFASFLTASNGFGAGILRIFLMLPRFARTRVLMEAVPEVDASKADPGELSGRIEVNRLSFGYEAGAPLVLEDVSFTVEPGEFVAFVGASGSGKSTLMKLLLGFERPLAGGIFYDGQDLRKLDIQAVRRQIGVVLQNGRLMSGSIAENILGVSGGGAEEAWAAARQAGLAEDIQAMPMGLHTVLTAGGATLSGGQAQRLMIARALVGRPRLLFLDEATSALDNRSQAMVTKSLEQTAATRIVVAHRLSTIRGADRIHVLERGRIVQSGSFEALAGVPGPFADLVRRQLD